MNEAIELFESTKSYAGQAFWAIKIVLLLLSAITTVAVLKYLGGPVGLVWRWLFRIQPGKEPSEIAKGISHGLRMLVFSALICGVLWYWRKHGI